MVEVRRVPLERRRERCGIGVEVDEDEARATPRPAAAAGPKSALSKSSVRSIAGRTEQPTVEPVVPVVVRALERGVVARALAHLHRPVLAHRRHGSRTCVSCRGRRSTVRRMIVTVNQSPAFGIRSARPTHSHSWANSASFSKASTSFEVYSTGGSVEPASTESTEASRTCQRVRIRIGHFADSLHHGLLQRSNSWIVRSSRTPAVVRPRRRGIGRRRRRRAMRHRSALTFAAAP